MSENFTVTNSPQNIGGLEFIIANGNIYIPYLIAYIIGMIVGCSGNLLIMFAIILTKDLHNSTNTLIFNLSLADFVISAFVDGFTIIGIFVGKNFFDKFFTLCEIIAAVCLVACSTSMLNIAFLSVNRYISICHHKMYDKVFSKKNTIVFCCFTWFVGILVDLPCALGWSKHTFNTYTLNCVWDRAKNHAYSLFFPLSTIVIPCCCVFVCYLKIYLYVVKIKQKVACASTSKNNNDSTQSIRIAKGLFASFMLFTFSWAPYGIVVMADWYLTFPATAEIYTMLIAHMNSALNPILYYIYNPMFRKGYKNVLRIVTRQKEATIETTVTKTKTIDGKQ